MLKVLGSHSVGEKCSAVLECGHEIPYNTVKWVPEGDTLVGMGKCAKGCSAPKAEEPKAEAKAPDHSEQ